MSYSIGCDPEFFLRKNGKFIPAWGKFPGTKDEPHKLDRGAVQVDGLALEFNITPAKTVQTFAKNVATVLRQVRELIDREMGPDTEMVFVPFATFPASEFQKLPAEAKVLGCDPDYNIAGNQNPRPAIGNEFFRTAAGHIHIGWDKGLNEKDPKHFEDCRFVANYFHDRYLHFWPLRDSPWGSMKRQRLQYYGMNGSFRPKTYGVELRESSNEWVEIPDTVIRMFNFIQTNMNKLKTNY